MTRKFEGRGRGAGLVTKVVAALAVALSLCSGGARADDAPSSLAGEVQLGADDPLIEAGLDRLVEIQDARTGAIGGPDYIVASTSLAGLALLASGDTWGRGPRCEAVQRAVDFLLDSGMKRRSNGYVFFSVEKQEAGRMHAHGMAMLFLAECYGTTDRDPEIRAALEGAIKLTVDAQTDHGGWGYNFRGEPDSGQDEASVTITQIQALRACRNAGLSVDPDVIARAIEYVRESMNRVTGACRYSLTNFGGEGDRVSYELTAAAVATLNASGVYDSPQLALGLKYLHGELNKVKTPGAAASSFYYYGNLYAAQAFYQAGGSDWVSWYASMRKELAEKRTKKDDAWVWTDDRTQGEAYATASAVLILEMPRRLLPIFAK